MTFDISRWLVDIGLEQYTAAFLKQDFDGPGLATLTDAELRELGVAAMGHRKTILREVSHLARPISETDGQSAHLNLVMRSSIQAPPMPRGRVFLSYGHDPACLEIVQRISLDLQSAGWDPWVDDKRIVYGDDWRREITRGILDSQHVLAFLSQHSTRKPGVCRQEVAIALGPRKGHVYTVLVEPLNRVSPPLILSHLQWLDMQQWQELKTNNPTAYETLYTKSLNEILRVLERNEPFAGDIELLQSWLDPLDSTAEMLAAEEGFKGRRWLLDGLVEQEEDESAIGEIEIWRTSGSTNRVFWLSAGPGWGKSAVAARLAHAARARVLAVHFCRYNKPNTRDARKVVRTLAFQMATQLGDYRELLVRLAKLGTSLAELDAMELFDKLLANPLVHELGGGRSADDRHLIVLDALDETLENGHSELLNLVAGEFGKLPPWLGLVVTSRPEAPLKRQLGAFGVQQQIEDDPRNLEDLRGYVQAWLQDVALDPAKRKLAQVAVLKASQGMFLYVRQLRDAVNTGTVPAEQLTDPALLPKGLAGIYARWFQARFSGDLGQKEYDQCQRPLLEVILAAREPLPIALISALLGWGEYGEYKALEPLGTFCTKQGGTVSLFHKSLADWLANPEDSGRHFYANPTKGHQRLALRLWGAYTQWRETGAHLYGSAGWSLLGGAGETYSLKHLCAHLKAADREKDARGALGDFALAMRRCFGGALEGLLEDYRPLRQAVSSDPLQAWADGIVTQAHLLRRCLPEWGAERILLQVASEHADDSPLTKSAEHWLQRGECDWVWVRRVNRPKRYRPSPVLSVMEGHLSTVNGAQVINDGRVLSWSADRTLRLWDEQSGAPLVVMEGHTNKVCGAKVLNDGRVLSWSEDYTLRLWDGQSGMPLAVMKGHTSEVTDAQVLIDGRVLSWCENDDFALRLWDGQSGAPLAVMEGHTKALCGTHVMPDGRVLSWSWDHTLRLWDGQSGAPLTVMEHVNAVSDVKVLPDGRLLSWSSWDGTIRLWDGRSGVPLAVMGGHNVQVLPDGRFLSWCVDNTLRLWDDKSGAPLALLEGHTGSIVGAQVLPDGRLLSWSVDNTLRLWDGQSGAPLAVMEGHTDSVLEVKVLPDGRLLSWSVDNTLRLWDGQSGAPLTVMEGHTSSVREAQVLPDGKLLSWDGDSTLRLWDGQSGAPLLLMEGHTAPIVGAQVLPNGRVLSWSFDKSLRLWDSQIEAPLGVMEEHTGAIVGVKMLPDGRLLSWCGYSINKDYNLRLWDGQSGALEAVLRGHTDAVRDVQVLPDGRLLSWQLFGDQTLRLWDSQSGALLAVMVGHTSNVNGAQALPEGLVLSWSVDNTLRLWDDKSGAELAVMRGHSGEVKSAQVLSDGRVLSWSADNTLRLWDGQSGAPLAVMKGHTGEVSDAEVLSDGRVLSWSVDNTLRLWDGQNGAPLAVMKGHTGEVECAQVLSDGRVLSWSWSGDTTLRLWDGQSGALLAVMEGHSSEVNGAEVLLDGRVLSWSVDNTLRLWDGKSGAALAVMEGHTKSVYDAKALSDGRVLSWSVDNTLRLWDGQSGAQLGVIKQPWVWDHAFSKSLAYSHNYGEVKRIGHVWAQRSETFVAYSHQSGAWRALWHGAPTERSCETGSQFIVPSGRILLFLQLMRGANPFQVVEAVA